MAAVLLCFLGMTWFWVFDAVKVFAKFFMYYLAVGRGEKKKQKLKSHLLRTQSLKVLPLKPGVGQYIAIHAMLTAREFFLASFYPSSPFTSIFSKTSFYFFSVLAVAKTGSCTGPQNKMGYPSGCRFP